MSAYVRILNAAIAEDQASRANSDPGAIVDARARLTPLEDRLARLLTTIPLEVQKEGLSLPALQSALRGRWRGSCHPGELGTALRKLGFVRQRDWGGQSGFQAVWRKAE